MEKEIMCLGCKKNFTLTPGEIHFYTNHKTDEGKDMVLPKRCQDCRNQRKHAKKYSYQNTQMGY